MKLPRSVRKSFPGHAGDECLQSTNDAIVFTDDRKSGRQGSLHMTDDAIYVVSKSWVVGRTVEMAQFPFDELVDGEIGATQSRFGAGDPVIFLRTPTDYAEARLKVDTFVGSTKRFLEAFMARQTDATNRWLTYADMMMLAWELDHAEDHGLTEDEAADVKVLVCDTTPTVRELVARTIQKHEDAGDDFGSDDITDRIIKESGYISVRERVLAIQQ